MNSTVSNPYRKVTEYAKALRQHLETLGEGTPKELLLDNYGVVKDSVLEIIGGANNPVFQINESWSGGVNIIAHLVNENGERVDDANYEDASKNRMNFILYRMHVKSVHRKFVEIGSNFAYNAQRSTFQGSDKESLITMLKLVEEAVYTNEDIVEAIGDYNDHLRTMRTRVNAANLAKSNGEAKRGISARIFAANAVELDKDAIEAQILEASTKLTNGLVGRTWGWEVEAPNPGEFRTPAGVEAGSDGSVESYEANNEDCDCSCRDCTYHSCDCDNCDQYNEDPNHCGDDDCETSKSYEFRTVGGVTRILHPGLKNLLEQIGETEKNETAGTHIHVYARDLNAFQIGTVLGAYALTQRVWDVLAGRNANDDARCKTYANVVPAENVSYTLRHKKLSHVGKFNAVNTHHVATDRGTLEFRQMDCNFDFKRISLMAFMTRGLVEVAKRGAQISDFMHITDLNGLIKIYAKYGFTYDNETENIDNPHGSRYNQSRVAPVCA